MTNGDGYLLIAQVEYASWALNHAFDVIANLPLEALTYTPGNSCRSMFATLQHLYETDWYYFVHLKGGTTQAEVREGAARIPECQVSEEYEKLKQDFLRLRTAVLEWARENLSAQKDTVLHGWGTWTVWQVVMHMSNHTTHHLGQISTLARQAGCAPTQSDWTDLIIFYLQRYPSVPVAAEA